MTVPEKKQMNAGVELLLKRMETHPEEFTDYGKWVSIMQEIHKYAEPEESKAINDGLKALMMQKVTERVLEGLVDPKPLSKLEELLQFKQQSAMQQAGATHARSSAVLNNTNVVTGTISANPYTNTLTIGNQTLDQETIEHMKAHLEYIQKQKQKGHKTLFGKLFNYL